MSRPTKPQNFLQRLKTSEDEEWSKEGERCSNHILREKKSIGVKVEVSPIQLHLSGNYMYISILSSRQTKTHHSSVFHLEVGRSDTKKNEHLRLRFLVFSPCELSRRAPGSNSITIRKRKATADHRLSVTSRPSHEITHFSTVLLAACLSGRLVNRMAPPNLLL